MLERPSQHCKRQKDASSRRNEPGSGCNYYRSTIPRPEPRETRIPKTFRSHRFSFEKKSECFSDLGSGAHGVLEEAGDLGPTQSGSFRFQPPPSAL